MALVVNNPPANAGDLRDTGWISGLGRKERLPTPVFWPGKFHELYSTWGCKELDMTEQLSLFTFKKKRTV